MAIIKIKIKVGSKVVPHAKTPDGRVQGLENSVVWKRAKQKNQPFLYVTRTYYVGGYPEIMCADNNEGFDLGDYFLLSDITLYKKEK